MANSSFAKTSFTFDINDLLHLKRVLAVAPSICGTWAAVALERLHADGNKYACDLWRVALDGAHPAIQLTRGKSRDCAPCFRADGALGFLSNRVDSDADSETETDAEKRAQVWILPAGGGEPQRLTDEPLGVTAFKFAADGDCLALLALALPNTAHEAQRKSAAEKAKNGPSALLYKSMPVRFWDHWLADATPHLIAYDGAGGKRRDLTPDVQRQLEEADFDVSADGAAIAITYASIGGDRARDVALMLFDVATGAKRLIGAKPRAAFGHPVFSPDGKTLACNLEARLPHRCPSIRLRLIDVASGQINACVDEWDRWPIPSAWSADGRCLFATADDMGATPVFEIELASGDISLLTTGGSHANVRICKNGSVIGIRSSIEHPPELFYLPLLCAEELSLPTCLSGFDPAAMPFSMEHLAVPSTDGHAVQAWLLKPDWHGPEDAPLPLLLWIHGGPLSAWGDGWHWRWNPLTALAQGYAVLLPNPRGSTGFGQAFVDGIWGNVWGRQCYEDLMAVVDRVAAREDIDQARMAAMGGSFGGYMTNWIGGQTTRFKCLITHASVYSMSGFTGVTDLPAYWMLQMDGDPYSDPPGFDRYSPSRFIANWKTPTLIIHGERDYRVPISEGLALFEALQYHGVDSELMIFPDENHWIVKPNNSIAWYQKIYEFLAPHLKA